MRKAATGNALSPTVDSRVGGTISADVDDDLRRRLELMSAIRPSSSEISLIEAELASVIGIVLYVVVARVQHFQFYCVTTSDCCSVLL